MKALVASEYSGCSSSGWFQTPVLGSGVGSISGIIVGGSNDIARCKEDKHDERHRGTVGKQVHEAES